MVTLSSWREAMGLSFKKLAGAVVVVLIAGYAFFALQGPQGIPGLMAKRRQIQDFEKQNAALARKIEEQRGRIGRLRDSQPDQDLEIRQRLKLVKPDEKVFILQDQSPAPSAR
jgi:cell division protein FtsB